MFGVLIGSVVCFIYITFRTRRQGLKLRGRVGKVVLMVVQVYQGKKVN